MRHAISFLRVVVAGVIVVFAVIGFLYVTRGGALKRVRGVGVTSGTVSAALRAAGVEVVAFRPLRISMLNVAQNRSHVRAIVIDGRIGWTGGFGIDDKWLGDGRSNGGWRDTNVRFEGPAVRQLDAAFAAAWCWTRPSATTRMRCSSTTSSMPPRSRATSFGSDRGPNGWSNEVRTSSHACSES